MTPTRVVRWAAGSLCALGVLLTVQSITTLPDTSAQLRKKIADLEQLRALQQEQVRQQAAIEMFEKLPSKRPLPIGDILGSALPGVQPSTHQRDSRPADAGWTVRSVEVLFDSVRLADLGRFIERAEALPGAAAGPCPPWRMIELNITASDQTPGSGRASVILEALEKSPGTR